MAKKVARKKGVKSVRAGKLGERAFGPAADKFGKELAPLGKDTGAVALKVGRMLLAPIRGMVVGLETVGNWLKTAIAERLTSVSEDKIVQPDPRIVVPAVQALTYSMGDEQIREMFANLLAAGMVAGTKAMVHPSFVEMIKQMTPIDAKILRLVHQEPQAEFRSLTQIGDKWLEGQYRFSFDVDGIDVYRLRKSLTNLRRLELIELRPDEWPISTRHQEIEEQNQQPIQKPE